MMTALDASLDRLESLVDGSIAALEGGGAVDDAAMAEAKGRALLELSRHRIPEDGTASDALGEKVTRLRNKLAREEKLLGVRLRAAELVSDLIAEALVADEWDGTYEPWPGKPRIAGRRPEGGS
jgi:hypothetical protein